MPLKPVKKASELLDLYYEEIRSHILEAASGFDRMDRVDTTSDPRYNALKDIAAILADDNGNKAERLLTCLSVKETT